MTDIDFEARLVRYLQARAEHAVEPFDASLIADTAIGNPQPRDRRLQMVLAAAVVALTLVGTVGAIVVGGLLNQRPTPSLPADVSSPAASAEPSAAEGADLIVYTRWTRLAAGEGDCDSRFPCTRASIFRSNQDGSNEQELFPGPYSFVVAAAPDGSRVIISQLDSDGSADRVFMTDANGSELRSLDIECQRLPCGDYEFTFSPDGTRLAFVRGLPTGNDDEETVIAVLDLATGAVIELDSTHILNPYLGDPCGYFCGPGVNRAPSWSPDGSQLVFTRQGVGTPGEPHPFGEKDLYVVNADGSNFRQLPIPDEIHPIDARWSPDGSVIAFTSSMDMLAAPGIDNAQQLNDIYTIRPDGTGLRRLTTDIAEPVGTTEPGEFGARFPSWTRDGRIVFTRNPEEGETMWQLWVMDSDGSNETRLDPSDPAALTAIGCVSCPYPGVDVVITNPSLAVWVAAP
jgi:Tol biopolymer transport system component